MQSHWLRRNHGVFTPQCCVALTAFALEMPLPGEPGTRLRRLHFGVANYFRFDGGKRTRGETFWFDEPGQFWSWIADLRRPGRGLWLWSYRLSEALTLTDFWGEIDRGHYSLGGGIGDGPNESSGESTERKIGESLLVTLDPPTIVCASSGGYRLHAVDVRNYYHESLDDIAKWCEVKRWARPGKGAGKETWRTWAQNENRIIVQCVSRLFTFWRTHKMGVFKYTASSLAFAHYRHAHMQEPILIDDCAPARKLSRAALAAGECRLWYCGTVAD